MWSRVQREDEVGLARVREGRTLLVGAPVGHLGAGEDDADAVGRQAPLDAAREVEGEVRLDESAVTVGAGVAAAVAGVEDDGAPAQAVAAAPDVLPLAQGVGGSAADGAAQAREGAHRLRTDRAVGHQAHRGLEGPQGGVGARSVETVDLAGGEAELGEAGLQGHDVVALDEVLGQVTQHAVTEGPARTVEDGIRGPSDDAVDDEPATLLEGLDRLLDALVVDGLADTVAVPWAAGEVAGEDEPLAHGGHGGAGIAAPEHD